MCTRTQDRQDTPARSVSRTSLGKIPATCVQDARIGYIQDVLVFETLRIIIEQMAGSVPPVGRHHSHHIPTGRRKLYTQQVPAEILAMIEDRDDLRKQDPASPGLSTMNDEITKATSDHKIRQWREFVESIDHRTKGLSAELQA